MPGVQEEMSKEDFEVSPTGTHKTIDTSYLRMKAIGDKIEAALARFQKHHEFMVGSEVLDER